MKTIDMPRKTKMISCNTSTEMDHLSSKIPIPQLQIEAFCIKWKVREFALFGSVVRDDFHVDSDVDVLITFEENAPWSLFEWVEMMEFPN